MSNILANAQELVYTLKSLMPSVYQRENFTAMLGLFLEARGYPLPQHSHTKSASNHAARGSFPNAKSFNYRQRTTHNIKTKKFSY